MMKKLIIKVIGVLLLILFIVYLFNSPRLKFDVLENPNKDTKKTTNESQFEGHQSDSDNQLPQRGIATWIGDDISQLTERFGQAKRSYPYKDGYKNYIFKREDQYYIVTTKSKKIKSVYATGEKASVSPFKISESAAHIFENLSINPEPTIRVNDDKYDIELSDIDMKTQMLVKFGDIYAQIYIDQQTNQIVAIRYLDSEALVEFKPYQMVNASNDKEVKSDFDDLPYEQNPNQLMTLYEVTNQMRHLRGEPPLKVNNDVANIAGYNLYEATGTDSVEFTEGALTQQLEQNQVPFQSASQNVGYDFNEVPTLIINWLNSDIHRSRMLNTKYDEMGGAVNDGYYTVIFLEEE